MNLEKIPFGLTFIEAIQTIGILVACVVILLITLDKLNIKKISIVPPGLEFYQDGDTKKSRVTGRKKIVRRKAK